MTNPFNLSEKHLLITGASSGIGKSTAILASQLGAKVSLTGRNEERLIETLSQMSGTGHSYFVCDLNNQESLQQMCLNLDKLDGVVYCAGTQETCVTKFLSRQVLNNVFETNFFSTVALNTALLSSKNFNKNASVVFVSSLAATKIAEVGNAAYSASKGAISAFSKVLALEMIPRRIRVNTVLPGMVKTPLMEKFNVSQEQFAENEKKYPLGYGTPEDVAAAITFLLSDASKWITGTDLILDGGLTLQ